MFAGLPRRLRYFLGYCATADSIKMNGVRHPRKPEEALYPLEEGALGSWVIAFIAVPAAPVIDPLTPWVTAEARPDMIEP